MAQSFTPPTEVHIHGLRAKDSFDTLSNNDKLYAHYMARSDHLTLYYFQSGQAKVIIRAAWHGTRIILHQVSPEAIGIFDFILELHNDCSGNWSKLVSDSGVAEKQLEHFLLYAATFLSNMGNYYVWYSFLVKLVPTDLGIWRSKVYSRHRSTVF
jgi:dipeptidyl-peptidase III